MFLYFSAILALRHSTGGGGSGGGSGAGGGSADLSIWIPFEKSIGGVTSPSGAKVEEGEGPTKGGGETRGSEKETRGAGEVGTEGEGALEAIRVS